MAAPSRANWEAVSPRDCTGCGRKLRITRDHIFFRIYPYPSSFCAVCAKPPRCIFCGAKCLGQTCVNCRDLLTA